MELPQVLKDLGYTVEEGVLVNPVNKGCKFTTKKSKLVVTTVAGQTFELPGIFAVRLGPYNPDGKRSDEKPN